MVTSYLMGAAIGSSAISILTILVATSFPYWPVGFSALLWITVAAVAFVERGKRGG